MHKSKKGVFDRFSEAAFGIKRPESGKVSRENLLGSCPVIDANFVEVNEDSPPDSTNNMKSRAFTNSKPISNSDLIQGPESFLHSNSINPELLEKLREYFKTRSQEKISELYDEIRKIIENRASKCESKNEAKGKSKGKARNETKGESTAEFNSSQGRCTTSDEKANIGENIREDLKSAFRFCSETACFGVERIINASKIASSTASSIASDGKESIKVSSKMLNKKWNELSPRDRKIIAEVTITLIEIGLLKSASKGKKAAFVILSNIYRRQTPGRNDLEELLKSAQWLFRQRH